MPKTTGTTLPLHTKYRPDSLDSFLGNDHIKTGLKSLLGTPTCPHTFLLHGPTGMGKTTLARIIAKELGCEDLREINAADARDIHSARQIINDTLFLPMRGNIKIYILDEIQNATAKGFQQVMLKPLEDTGEHVFYILCTTEPEQLNKTLLSRCTKYKLGPLPDDLIHGLLQTVLAKEGVEKFPEEAVKIISDRAMGCPRKALVSLGKVINIPTKEDIMTSFGERKTGKIRAETCELYIEQEIERGHAEGKTDYEIGKAISEWVREHLDVHIPARTIEQRGRRQQKKKMDATFVAKPTHSANYWSKMAISNLERIPEDDPQREPEFERVREWIEVNT